MKKKLLLIFILATSLYAHASKSMSQDPVVVEIADATLSQVYYHQMNFAVPTKLVFTNLTSVEGYVYFHQNQNLVEVDFPALVQTGNYVYFHGNANLQTVNMPALEEVGNYFYAHGNTSLTTLNICGLTEIGQIDEWSNPYYHISGNTPGVDATPFCFSLGGPTDLTLTGNTVAENAPVGTVVGTLSAVSNYPNGTLTYTLVDDFGVPFEISGNEIRTGAVLDYEAQSAYTFEVRAYNQLGEGTVSEFTVSVTDVASENLNVVEVTDTTMENVYYHQVSFDVPTKLVFTNLASVTGYVYFHQNPNLVEVEFPVLAQTGRYVYYHGNASLETVKMPVLMTIHDYLYVGNNTALTELDVCALTHILPGEGGAPYYYIHGNTPVVDGMDCFAIGAPSNIALSNASVSENTAPGTLAGTLSADTPNNGTVVFSLDGMDFDSDNDMFEIQGNDLRTATTFDYEVDHEYHVHVRATNQLGEFTLQDFTINITDVAVETLAVVEITDATLDNVYYHQVSFLQPTKLVFPNLTSVNGYVYFHQNVNLVEVEFPALTQTGEYFYAHGNQSLEKISAPALQTVHRYLYVANHQSLTELNICALAQILPGEDEWDATPYYYIEGNPSLDFDSTCLVNTTIAYTPVENIVILPAPDTLVGTFSCDTTDPVTYFFVDENGEQTTNDDFVIVGNGLYLAHDISYYDDTDFEVNIGSIRVDLSNDRISGGLSVTGLNEMNELAITVVLDSALGVDPTAPWASGIALAPNPAGNFFEIQSAEPLENVAVYDMLGRKVTGVQLTGNRADTSDLADGTYLVNITTASGTAVKRLLISK
jgi:hypothetical protein